MKTVTTSQFIERACNVHSNRYEYGNTEYIAMKELVTITCKVHGDFTQTAASHIRGRGCHKCNYIREAFKYNTEIFIKKSKEVHGDKYTYENTEYLNAKTLVAIRCSVHGDVLMNPYTHLKGSGCRKCADKINSMNYMKTLTQFIKDAQKVHGEFYGYDLVEYGGCNNKVTIRCPYHGVFEQSPSNHLVGTGCTACQGSSVYFTDSPTSTYYVRITNPVGLSLYKVGITTKDVQKRCISEVRRGYTIELIDTLTFHTGKPAYILEQYTLSKVITGKYVGTDTFLYKGIGDSELFTEPLNKRLSDIHNMIHKGNL